MAVVPLLQQLLDAYRYLMAHPDVMSTFCRLYKIPTTDHVLVGLIDASLELPSAIDRGDMAKLIRQAYENGDSLEFGDQEEWVACLRPSNCQRGCYGPDA